MYKSTQHVPRGPRELRHIMSVSSQVPLPPSLRGQHPIPCPRRPYREETLTSAPRASLSASSLNRAAKTRPFLTNEMTSWGPGILILSTDEEILAIAQVDQSAPENQEGEYRRRRPCTKEKEAKECLSLPIPPKN